MKKLFIISVLLVCVTSCTPSICGVYKREHFWRAHFVTPTIRILKDRTFTYEYNYGKTIRGTWTVIDNNLKLESDSFLPPIPDSVNIYSLFEPDYSNWSIITTIFYQAKYIGNFAYKQTSVRNSDMFRIEGSELIPFNSAGEPSDGLPPL